LIWRKVFLRHNVDPAYWVPGPEQSPGVVMRTRILAVVDHLKRISAKIAACMECAGKSGARCAVAIS
jgi:hypothetical protein